MKITRLIITLLLIGLGYYSTAREYHVSKTGDGKNPGTEAQPFATIGAAASIAQPGDTITVHEGIYRERVNPKYGGLNDLQRILYRAAEGEEVIIKGSEIVKEWQRMEGSVWSVEIPNSIFADYNPFADLLEGDWLNKKGMEHHTGEVFLNGLSLFEKASLKEVIESAPYADARDKQASTYTWYAEVGKENTILWANFQGSDPNQELVEINVREACFYPSRPGINYISVRGFIMDQAATQWAAPTAEQPGLIGTHWSKGWIIENNVISNSKSVGITLGKDRSTGQNVWMNNPVKDGATHYNEVIFRALGIGWSKEKIGSHLVRNNVISRCGQAGIVGSLGGVYSQIYNNHIYDIWTKRIFSGAEMAGIKIHASIDMLIKNNHIHNTGRGIWIDWMAQGTRVTGNLLYDNTTDDLFSEVNHGPYLVDNNLFLSDLSLRDWSEGGAFVHNLFAGQIEVRKVLGRFTPYHFAHTTRVAGLRNIYCGDNRFYNNLLAASGDQEETSNDEFVRSYGLKAYKIAEYENQVGGNVFLEGKVLVEEKEDGVYLEFGVEEDPGRAETILVTTELLGSTIVSEAIFEQPDGTPYTINRDYSGKRRNEKAPVAGPLESVKAGKQVLKIWDN
jgi:hypothetical protein